MSNIKYKEYSDEETRIYEENISKIRKDMNEGKTLKEISEGINVSDDSLKGFILDDALKIFIAEKHFVLGVSLDKISESLDVNINVITKAIAEMLEDIGQSSGEFLMLVEGNNSFGNA